MMPDRFSQAVDEIVERDPRFERDAYLFVRDALDHTTKRRKRTAARQQMAEGSSDASQHVTGQELLEGVRQFALDQYGPMVPAVFEHWRLSRCEDIGAMVFNLIEAGVFGKTENDTIADFGGGYDFHEAFVLPFLPSKAGGGRSSAPSARKPA